MTVPAGEARRWPHSRVTSETSAERAAVAVAVITPGEAASRSIERTEPASGAEPEPARLSASRLLQAGDSSACWTVARPARFDGDKASFEGAVRAGDVEWSLEQPVTATTVSRTRAIRRERCMACSPLRGSAVRPDPWLERSWVSPSIVAPRRGAGQAGTRSPRTTAVRVPERGPAPRAPPRPDPRPPPRLSRGSGG